MKTHPLTLSSLALGLLLAGCVGTGPNTQQGAVAGGALGALAGAVIGNNSRGHDAGSGALIGAAVGALAGGTIGNSIDHQQGTLYGDYSRAYAARVETRRAPPPLPPPPATADAVPPAPSPTALWITGYWAFDGRAYVWRPGHWEMPPPNARAYVGAHWERHGHRYYWIESYWQIPR